MNNPLERDELGLLKSFTYPRRSDNTINWRACLLPEHLYVNPEYETMLCTQFNVKKRWDIDVTKCEDKQLLVNQAGWNHLCFLRGLKAVTPGQPVALPGEVHMSVTVEFIPNFENPYGLIRGDSATASVYTERSKFQLHLASMAFNKAFARAVRLALRVPIYGQDEFADDKGAEAFLEAIKKGEDPFATKPIINNEQVDSKPAGYDGNAFLAHRCAELNRNGSHSFEKVKAHAITIKDELSADPSTWTSFESVSRKDAFTLVDKINKAAEGKKAKKS